MKIRFSHTTNNTIRREVIEEADGKFTAKITNLLTGATKTNSGWSFRTSALHIVQEMKF